MSRSRRLAGDWQSPAPLAAAITSHLARLGVRPAAVMEPTCGVGGFLEAAARTWPAAALAGREREADYVAQATARCPHAQILQSDAFTEDWRQTLANLPSPLLVLGNPPWVTASTAGARSSELTIPRKAGGGLDQVTGAGDFDAAEWLLRRWLGALEGRDGVVAMLVKTHVARRLLQDDIGRPVGLWRIDAPRWFGVSADACLYVVAPGSSGGVPCPVHPRLDAPATEHWGSLDGQLVRDLPEALATRHLTGAGPLWRSGVKHDAGKVLELTQVEGKWHNGLGDTVDIEDAAWLPLRKGGDLHRGKGPTRALLLPHRKLADDPAEHLASCPRTLAYLKAHRARLDARKSRIYRGRPPFCVFGLGDYTFAPWKVAVSALYPSLNFRLLGPEDGDPVVVDDTAYLLPFHDEASARAAQATLNGEACQRALAARLFPGAKRPVTARLLRQLMIPSERSGGHEAHRFHG